MLRIAGLVSGDDALIDSTVPESDIIHPNDVQLIHRAFRKMRAFAKQHRIPVWWDDKDLAGLWREFGPDKKKNRAAWLAVFNGMFVPALKIFQEKVGVLRTSPKRKKKAVITLNLLNILEEQTLLKIAGERHIKDRLFIKRMEGYPDTAVTDLGCRSLKNLENTPSEIGHVFMGRSDDVAEEESSRCRSARSATEGFIAVSKNLRGFGKSLWHRLEGHRMWSLICQTAHNLKKFLQLWDEDRIGEESLKKLGLA